MRVVPQRVVVIGLVAALSVAACSGSGSGSGTGNDAALTDSSSIAADVRRAAQAVEAELGGPQDFFEITATPQLTNVFVAIDGGTSAVPYVFVDGELRSPAPTIEGVEGQTFTLAAVDFDEATVLTGVATDLPAATIDAFSVEGGAGGFVRYVVSARSAQGGVLDIVVAPSGAVVEVFTL